jgi:hypothetical protein
LVTIGGTVQRFHWRNRFARRSRIVRVEPPTNRDLSHSPKDRALPLYQVIEGVVAPWWWPDDDCLPEIMDGRDVDGRGSGRKQARGGGGPGAIRFAGERRRGSVDWILHGMLATVGGGSSSRGGGDRGWGLGRRRRLGSVEETQEAEKCRRKHERSNEETPADCGGRWRRRRRRRVSAARCRRKRRTVEETGGRRRELVFCLVSRCGSKNWRHGRQLRCGSQRLHGGQVGPPQRELRGRRSSVDPREQRASGGWYFFYFLNFLGVEKSIGWLFNLNCLGKKDRSRGHARAVGHGCWDLADDVRWPRLTVTGQRRRWPRPQAQPPSNV